MLASVRRFFAERDILEVETPCLSHAIGTDVHLEFFSTEFRRCDGDIEQTLYLQTSPEFAMKRLLAAGSGSIYQICKAYRNQELGQLHNPEFTILEWYRKGADLQALMDDINSLFCRLFEESNIEFGPSQRIRFRDIFFEETGIDLATASVTEFKQSAKARAIKGADKICGENLSLWIDYLFSHFIQPHMGQGRLTFIYEYPRCQAALAKLLPRQPQFAERMEVYFNGIELANGYDELTDPKEQMQRFNTDMEDRKTHGLRPATLDQRLINALASGMPACSGVAVGLDRLLMILTGAEHIDQVLAFSHKDA